MTEGRISVHDPTRVKACDSLSIEGMSGKWPNSGDGDISEVFIVDKLEERLDVNLKVPVLVNNPSLSTNPRNHISDSCAVWCRHVAAKKLVSMG